MVVKKKIKIEKDGMGGDNAGGGRPPPATFIDQRLRHSTTDWKTAAKAGCEIGAGDCQKFLIAVESITVFFRKHSTDRSRLDRSKKEASEREREKIGELVPAHHWQRGQRRSARH